VRDANDSTGDNDPSDPDNPSNPGRYIERVSLETGQVLERPPQPEELLVHRYRGAHPLDVHTRHMLSRAIRKGSSERMALRRLTRLRAVARASAQRLARLLRTDPERTARALFGLEQPESFFRFKRPQIATRAWVSHVLALEQRAASRLDAARRAQGEAHLYILLTGATGFIGKEIVWQAVRDPAIAGIEAVIRPRVRRDARTGAMLVTRSAAQRGQDLLDELGITEPAARARFHAISGDVEKPGFGLGAEALNHLAGTVTHLVHCAASVAFDAPYGASFRANVRGTLHALAVSRDLERHAESRFVAHIGIETSYIHGRRLLALAREDTLSFPRNYYNNYYELTKAMASIESERFMLEQQLPVIQLCPSIVIGDSDTGNNRGDTKVVNAPVNLFGRAREAIVESRGTWRERSKIAMLARLASVFPSDPSAEINLIPVDRVARGVLAALRQPRAVGRRIHLANDRRITAAEIADILNQELGVHVRLVEPTLHRTVGLPLMGRLLGRFGAGRLVSALGKMTDVFGGYAEWGQPVHEVGNDVRLLGLDPARPDPCLSFRMLCRHNRWVQRFGRLRNRRELAAREHAWREFLRHLAVQEGCPPATLSANTFAQAVRTAGFDAD